MANTLATQVDFLLSGCRKNDGSINANGKVYFFSAGTTTTKAVYKAKTQSGNAYDTKTAIVSDPHDTEEYVLLDANGFPNAEAGGLAEVYADGTYDIYVYDSSAGAGGTPEYTISSYSSFLEHDHSNAINGGDTLESPTINTPTIDSITNVTLVTPTISDLTNMTHAHISDATGGELTGMTVQAVHTQTGVVATGTTTIPLDDTIPQITEGDEYMTLAITPTSATNKLLIEVFVGMLHHSSVLDPVVALALFQDSTADAIAVITTSRMDSGANTLITNGVLRHEMTSGTTSSITFKLRIGADLAGTLTFNGNSSARKYGGVVASSIRIIEVQV